MLAHLAFWMTLAAAKFEAIFIKVFSMTEKRSQIYAFHIMDDWESGYLFKCPSKPHIWYKGVPVIHHKRVEHLVHLALMAGGFERVQGMCIDFHQEIFRLLSVDAWETIIKPMIEEVDAKVES
ncbi:hypothetical protein Moror_8802 [Moniliophthora roreri MCA 2997]|uniref:Bacteriophage T5 Orf172 DNA-binding domain-containing protein n=2 Tax=Moniliophthora roreri TaxID=221103 RepID=V2XV86_MONRO|nr:hypothetical protein Moror_8802 [Moniliophthora roreri MCA 2997]